jgi:hypothetical protein
MGQEIVSQGMVSWIRIPGTPSKMQTQQRVYEKYFQDATDEPPLAFNSMGNHSLVCGRTRMNIYKQRPPLLFIPRLYSQYLPWQQNGPPPRGLQKSM